MTIIIVIYKNAVKQIKGKWFKKKEKSHPFKSASLIKAFTPVQCAVQRMHFFMRWLLIAMQAAGWILKGRGVDFFVFNVQWIHQVDFAG